MRQLFSDPWINLRNFIIVVFVTGIFGGIVAACGTAYTATDREVTEVTSYIDKFCDGDNLIYTTSSGSIAIVQNGC